MIERPSPNFGARPTGTAVDMLILHYTGMESAEAALDRMCDATSQVSAHYMIDEDGGVYRLVADDMRAWHAGRAWWAGATDVNDRSIGIELVNPGHEFGYRPFPELQMVALEALAGAILGRHPIPPERVLGHSDVAPDRKQDPGELFDWQRLARAGIGLWPEPAATPSGPPSAAGVLRLLSRHGYRDDGSQQAFVDAVTAFQRHFRPARFDGVLDAETFSILAALAGQSA